MKKVILLVAISALTFSCEKMDDANRKVFCWKCISAMSTKVSGTVQAVNQSEIELFLTEEQADEVEDAGTSTTTSSSGGVKVVVKSTMYCSKNKAYLN